MRADKFAYFVLTDLAHYQVGEPWIPQPEEKALAPAYGYDAEFPPLGH